MMAKMLFVVLAVLAASVAGELTPQGCAQYLLSDSALGSTPGFLPNLLFYNAGSLMSGSPQGPWFKFQQGLNCYFIPNTTLTCPITLYQDSARTQAIGSGSLSTDATHQLFVQNGFIGGDIVLSYTINSGAVTTNPSPATNYQSQTTVIHFEPHQTYPATGAAVANLAQYSADRQSGVLTLWGSNGWNGSAFSGQTTGLDFRATLSCPQTPPIIPPCSPAPGSSFTAPYGCVAANQPVRFHSSTTSIGLSFTTGAAAGCSNF